MNVDELRARIEEEVRRTNAAPVMEKIGVRVDCRFSDLRAPKYAKVYLEVIWPMGDGTDMRNLTGYPLLEFVDDRYPATDFRRIVRELEPGQFWLVVDL